MVVIMLLKVGVGLTTWKAQA